MAKPRQAEDTDSRVVPEKEFQSAVLRLLNTPPQHKTATKQPRKTKRRTPKAALSVQTR